MKGALDQLIHTEVRIDDTRARTRTQCPRLSDIRRRKVTPEGQRLTPLLAIERDSRSNKLVDYFAFFVCIRDSP